MHNRMFAEDRVLYLESMLQRRNIEYLNLKKENGELLKEIQSLRNALKEKPITEIKEEQVEESAEIKPKIKKGRNARNTDTD